MILAIDLGSTVFKAELFDHNLGCLGRGAAAVPYAQTAEGQAEMPVAETRAALRQAVTHALHTAGCGTAALQAVALTSQAQTFTIRQPDGTAKFPFISWRDSRSALHNVAATALPDFAEHSGVGECLPVLTVANLAYLQHQAKGTLLAADDRLVWLPTWFVAEWTGQTVVDENLAAMSGLYSLKSNGWWKKALDICGLRSSHLPALTELGGSAGVTTAAAAAAGLPPGIPVVLAGNDQTAGAYGAGIHENNAILITLGTAQVVYACQGSLPPTVPGLIRGPYPHGRFYQLAADNCGAGTVNWARTILTGCASEAEFDQAAASAPHDCHGVRFVADDNTGTGHWTGLDENPHATVADQARAVLVCLTQRLGRMLHSLNADPRRQPILLTGGGSESTPWRECLTQQLQLDFVRLDAASPPRGAACLALTKC